MECMLWKLIAGVVVSETMGYTGAHRSADFGRGRGMSKLGGHPAPGEAALKQYPNILFTEKERERGEDE